MKYTKITMLDGRKFEVRADIAARLYEIAVGSGLFQVEALEDQDFGRWAIAWSSAPYALTYTPPGGTPPHEIWGLGEKCSLLEALEAYEHFQELIPELLDGAGLEDAWRWVDGASIAAEFMAQEEAKADRREAYEAFEASWNWRRFRETNTFDADEHGNVTIQVGGRLSVYPTRLQRDDYADDAAYLDALWLELWERIAVKTECHRLEGNQ